MSSAGPGGAASSADHQAPRTPQSHSDPCTVHEFLTRVVTDPHTRAAFQADPAAAASAAGFGDLDAGQLGQACAFALDHAPADVVETYRSSLDSALAEADDPVRSSATRAAHHPISHRATEVAAAHFGHAGDADKIMAAHSSAPVNVHGVLPGDPINALSLELPEPTTGALPQGAEQGHDTASKLPAVGPTAEQITPAHLPTPGQLPNIAKHVAAHSPEQLHATAGSLPIAGPVAEPVAGPAAGPIAGPVAAQVPGHLPDDPPSPDAAGPVTSLAGHTPATGGAPSDHLPVVGDVPGQLPLH